MNSITIPFIISVAIFEIILAVIMTNLMDKIRKSKDETYAEKSMKKFIICIFLGISAFIISMILMIVL